MYPNLYYLVKDWFGVEWNFLKIANSFGLMVAMAFIAAAWVLTFELKRKQKQGLLTYTEKEITVGAPASSAELFINFVLGFIFGFKILGVLLTPGATDNPQAYILSGQGNILAGIAVGGLMAFLKWREFNKLKLDKPEKRIIRLWPADRVGDLVIYAAVFGFLGAKLFHNLENWNEFVKDPIGSFISFSGLTFYGGLICAAIAIIYYAYKNKIGIWHLADAFGPALILAYGVGRIGCQVSGDGDWGILNSAFINDGNGNSVLATKEQFMQVLHANQAYYANEFKQTANGVMHINVKPFWGLPNWMFGYCYPNNVLSAGTPLPNCVGKEYCNSLPLAAFPTPFYETIMSFIIFGILMLVRKSLKGAGALFGLYLMFNGTERFLIEKIRVNNAKSYFGFHLTQAEIIAMSLFLIGLIIFVWRIRKKNDVIG